MDTEKDLLRFLTCGSVDDGKSTMIGRLLHDSKQIYDDHLQSLEKDSKKVGSAGQAIDFSLLLDGLKAEREQGITIDVAYRYFSTPRRKFIIADCPGHVQYTRNMITGGSTCGLAIVLIDARQGILEQTRRHSFLVSLLDIGHMIVAVNKMDLVGYQEEIFNTIRDGFTEFATRLSVRDINFIPMSALLGDNIVDPSSNMPWYKGATLLDALETVHIASDRNFVDFRLPVQYVMRQSSDFRGYMGTIASGILRPGSEVEVLPSRQRAVVTGIHTFDGKLEEAFPPMAVSVTLDREIDVSRGDTLVSPKNLPRVSSEFEATLVWMDERPLSRDRSYHFKLASTETRAQVADLRYRFDINTLSRAPAETLAMNEIGRVRLELARAIAFDPYQRNRATGAFIMIDPVSHQTVGAGMILDRSTDSEEENPRPDRSTLHPKDSQVTRIERANRLKQTPYTVWLTGLPKSGKSTIAYALERKLFDLGYSAMVLDGANLRLGLSDNLGFSRAERGEAARRAAHVARLMNDAGMVCIVATVSPFESDRQAARAVIGPSRFMEVFVDAPLEVCEQRDDEQLYQKVDKFTGVSAPYERPQAPQLVVQTDQLSLSQAVETIVDTLLAHVKA